MEDYNQLQILYDLFGEILEMTAHICREYLKAVENAKHIYRGSSQEEIEDFLQSIDRIITLEHEMDEVNRTLIELLVNRVKEFKQFYIFSEIAKNIEEATDSLMKASINFTRLRFSKLDGSLNWDCKGSDLIRRYGNAVNNNG